MATFSTFTTKIKPPSSRERKEQMFPDETFPAFPKIPRWRRQIVLTEKIDGTNGMVYIGEDGKLAGVGSRTRWIAPGKDDNFGFAAYVHEHKEAFEALGPGKHYGEWWGKGIQRNYGLEERRFSLFNTSRWSQENLPEGIHVVPLLAIGNFGGDDGIDYWLDLMRDFGSFAVPGFMRPEGLVLYHTASSGYFKILLENDDVPKSVGERAILGLAA